MSNIVDMNWYTIKQLRDMGIRVLGNNIKISNKTSIYNPTNIILHDNIRIDDFCILSAKGPIEINNFIHIGSHVLISSSKRIELHNFCGIASGSKLYGSNDDYSGVALLGPTVPEYLRQIKDGQIICEEYSSIGAGLIVLPDVVLSRGSILGTLSVLKKTTEPWTIYGGNPAKILKKREKDCIQLGERLRDQLI